MVATILLAKPYIIFVSEDCFNAPTVLFQSSRFHRFAIQSFKVSLLRCFRVSSHLRCCFMHFVPITYLTFGSRLLQGLITYHLSLITYHLSLITYHLSLITYHLSLLAPISYPWHMLSNAGRRLSGIGSTGGETILRGSIGVPPFHTRKSR